MALPPSPPQLVETQKKITGYASNWKQSDALSPRNDAVEDIV
jgi:hypothetical protein